MNPKTETQDARELAKQLRAHIAIFPPVPTYEEIDKMMEATYSTREAMEVEIKNLESEIRANREEVGKLTNAIIGWKLLRNSREQLDMLQSKLDSIESEMAGE